MSNYMQIVIQRDAKILKIMSDEESRYICVWTFLANNSKSWKTKDTLLHLRFVFSEVKEMFLRE